MWGFRQFASVAIFALASTAANAAPFTKSNAYEASWRTGVSLHEGATHRTPSGFARLCEARPELCPEYRTRVEVSRVVRTMARSDRDAARPSRQLLDRRRLEQLRRVNITVNEMIRPRRESRDEWVLSTSEGDCEEYALMKREVLASLGWARSALSIAAVKTSDGQDHAVLVVRTQFEDLVLDNLNDEVKGLGATTHTYVAAESFEQPGRWVNVSVERGGPDTIQANTPARSPRLPAAIQRGGKRNRL